MQRRRVVRRESAESPFCATARPCARARHDDDALEVYISELLKKHAQASASTAAAARSITFRFAFVFVSAFVSLSLSLLSVCLGLCLHIYMKCYRMYVCC